MDLLIRVSPLRLVRLDDETLEVEVREHLRLHVLALRSTDGCLVPLAGCDGLDAAEAAIDAIYQAVAGCQEAVDITEFCRALTPAEQEAFMREDMREMEDACNAVVDSVVGTIAAGRNAGRKQGAQEDKQ